MSDIAAVVAGQPVSIRDIDARERELRSVTPAAMLPRTDTSEGRQLRRWLAQLIVTEHVIGIEAERRGVSADDAPAIDEVLPDMVARHDVGSIAAAVLAEPLARAMFRDITAGVGIADDDVRTYHDRHPHRFVRRHPGPGPWQVTVNPDFAEVQPLITAHLLGAARRRVFRIWLDAARAEHVTLATGYEHPGDPRQPDNVHRH